MENAASYHTGPVMTFTADGTPLNVWLKQMTLRRDGKLKLVATDRHHEK